VTQSIPGTYDLITSFDVMHDLPHPRLALAAEAEFGHVRRLDFPANPFNLFYKLRVEGHEAGRRSACAGCAVDE
jgi:hypothetical protein